MVTGLLSFVVFILSFSLLTNGLQMNNEQCPPINIISTPPQEHIVRWTEGYKHSQYLDYLSSTVPSLSTTRVAALQRADGDSAALSEDVLQCIAADSDAWSIPASGYVNIAGNKPAIFTMAKEEEDRRTETLAEEEKERQAKTEQPEWVGKQYIIGLRNNGDVEKHLALLPAELQAQVEQLIPEINGYAVPSTVSPNTLELIRKDSSVGFIVTKPRGFFFAEGGEGLKGDEKEDYEMARWWSTLQSQDPFLETTDNGDILVPLSWKLEFCTPETKSLHLYSLPPHLKAKITWDRKKDYFVTFAAKEEENQWLEIVGKENGVLALRPLREYLVNDGEMWDEQTGDWKVLEHWQGYW